MLSHIESQVIKESLTAEVGTQLCTKVRFCVKGEEAGEVTMDLVLKASSTTERSFHFILNAMASREKVVNRTWT